MMYEYHGIKVFAIFIDISQHYITLTFYTFHFLPSQRALAFFNTTRRETKALSKNDSAVKKYFYLTRILYFNNEEKTF